MRNLFRQAHRLGSYIIICMINMLLHFRWSIPAWLLLAAYLIFGYPPLWAFYIALGFWAIAAFLVTTVRRLFLGLMRRLAYMPVGNSGSGGGKVVYVDENTPNKNPYSATRQKEEEVKAGSSMAVDGADFQFPQSVPTYEAQPGEAREDGFEWGRMLHSAEASEPDESGKKSVF